MNDEKSAKNKEILELNRRLGVVISLLLRIIPREGGISLKEQVRILDDLGMRPRDMAEILGRTQPHINKELAGLRKKKNKKHKKHEEEK